MKAFRVATGCALMLAVAGCGGSSEEAADAPKMPDVIGKQLDVALTDIERAGIDDEPEIVGGGTFGVIDESNWTVCDQSPSAEEGTTTTPELTVDRSCGDESAETTEPSTAPTTEPTVASTEPPTTAPQEVLTPANSHEFAAILREGDSCSGTIEGFAFVNGGRTIEFDGSIDNVAQHDSYDTRHDILMSVGNFDENSSPGPAFQFRNVNMFDLNLTGPNIPDFLQAGHNVHVVATVQGYEREGGCLFLLDPVSVSMR